MNTRRLAITVGLGLLALVLTLAAAQAMTVAQSGSAAPQGDGMWTPLGGPMVSGGQVNGFAVHPIAAGTAFAAVAPFNAYDSGPSTIYKTIDGADSWDEVTILEHQVYALEAIGSHVYAGAFNPGETGPGIYASHNSGVTWTPVMSFTGRGVWLDIATDGANPNRAIAGGWVRPPGADADQGVVYATDDGGVTWTPALTVTVPGEDSAVNAVLIHPVTPTLWLAAARVGWSDDSVIYRSEDGGVTWPTTFTFSGTHVMSLAAQPDDPWLLFAGTGNNQQGGTWGPNQVHRSADAGVSWELVVMNAGGLVAVEPPSTVYAVGPEYLGLAVSTANGDLGTWFQVHDWWPGYQNTFGLDLDTTPAKLYVGGRWSGVSRSANGGVDWEGANNGIETAAVPVDITVDPQDLSKLFVAAHQSGGWVSTDGGQTWEMPSGLAQHMFAFAVNPEDSAIVYGGASGCSGVVRSEDGGFNFVTVYSPTHGCVGGGYENFHAVEIALADPQTVYAGGEDHPAGQDSHAAIVRTLNDGISWTEVLTLPAFSYVRVLAVNPRDAMNVYAGGEDCHDGPCHGFIYRTTDGGETWDLSLTISDTVSAIVIDQWQPNVVYTADDVYYVRKSTDGGDTWAIVREPWWIGGDPSGNLLAVDPNVPNHVYLGGWGYIAETLDGGETWSEWEDPLNNGTPGMNPTALTADYGTVTQTLYAGFTGVWAYGREALQMERVCLPVVFR